MRFETRLAIVAQTANIIIGEKTMKRKISGFLVVVFAFLMMSVTSTAMAANFEVSISYF